jgi:hypothetical protein
MTPASFSRKHGSRVKTESIDRVDAVNDEMVKGFYPWLYLKLGKAYEDLGSRKQAKRNYELASLSVLAEDGHGRMVRDGIKRGLQRVS